MKIGDYVRTKKRGFQYPQIARIRSMSKDSGYKNQYFIELDHNLLPDYEFQVYEEDIDKSSPNIIDLIEAGDYVNGLKIEEIYCCGDYEGLGYYDEDDRGQLYVLLDEIDIKSIVTNEQFESMEYKVGEDNEV